MSTNVTQDDILWNNSPLYAETCCPNHSDAYKHEHKIFPLFPPPPDLPQTKINILVTCCLVLESKKLASQEHVEEHVLI
jgi:hypothetical protein